MNSERKAELADRLALAALSRGQHEGYDEWPERFSDSYRSFLIREATANIAALLPLLGPADLGGEPAYPGSPTWVFPEGENQ